MNAPATAAMQAFAYIGFAAAVGILSAHPVYRYADPGKSVLTLSVSHATERVRPCVLLTPEEIAALPPNMRRDSVCERERHPLIVELSVDGSVSHFEAAPSGLWSDGPASIYQKIELAPGRHEVTARLRDSGRATGWDYEKSTVIDIEPGRYRTIKFRPETGGFRFQ